MKETERPTSDSPRASARRGCVLAKSSRREKTASAARLSVESRDHLPDLFGRDPVDVPEEDGAGLPGEPGVEAEEKHAEPERHRQHHADGHVAAMHLVARRAHERARADGEQEHAFQRAQPEDRRARRAGEADVGERVGGEADVPDHDEVADDRPEDRGGRAGDERVLDEIVAEISGQRPNHGRPLP